MPVAKVAGRINLQTGSGGLFSERHGTAELMWIDDVVGLMMIFTMA